MSWVTEKAQAIAASCRDVGRLDKQIARSMKTHGVFAQSNRRHRKVALRHAAFVNTVRLYGELRAAVKLALVKQHSKQTTFPSVTAKQWSRAAAEASNYADIFARQDVKGLLEQAGIDPMGLIIDVEIAWTQPQR